MAFFMKKVSAQFIRTVYVCSNQVVAIFLKNENE